VGSDIVEWLYRRILDHEKADPFKKIWRRKMNFAKVAQISEIASGHMKKVVYDSQEILVANIGGTFYAISKKCTHMGGHLSQGTLQDGIVTCPRHGAKFDVKTGQSVEGAKVLFRRMGVKDTRSYPVKIEGNDILIGID